MTGAQPGAWYPAKERRGKMTRQGWSVQGIVALPPLWELREDEDFLYLFDPTGGVVVLGKHTTAETIKTLTQKDQREEARKC